MKTRSLNRLINHNFFLYGMVFISILQLLNFYNAKSLTCLGVFGITYYLACNATKNQGLCLLAANIVSIFLLGCTKSGIMEGMGHGQCSNYTNLDNCPVTAPNDHCRISEETLSKCEQKANLDPNVSSPTGSCDQHNDSEADCKQVFGKKEKKDKDGNVLKDKDGNPIMHKVPYCTFTPAQPAKCVDK